jgi:transposase, IS5 family
MTSANPHDGRMAEALIQRDEEGYFADKAYDSQVFRDTLERRRIMDGVAWRVKPPRYPL